MDKVKINLSCKVTGFFNFLTLVFIVLKLTGVVTWSWVKVLSPSVFIGGLYIFNLILTVFIITVITITNEVLTSQNNKPVEREGNIDWEKIKR